MEVCELTVNKIVMNLSKPAYKGICQSVINYLDLQDLQALNFQLERASSSHQFGQLIRTYFFLLKYLNQIDRSFYYNFYEHPHFLEIENSHINHLASHCSNNFLPYPRQYRACLAFIQALLPQEVSPEDFVEELERMIVDTSIPLPKLKRENQGMFCKTSFQNFLVDQKYQHDKKVIEYFPPFEAIQTYFQSQEQKYLQKLFIRASKDPSLDLKVRSLRFTPYQITFQNFSDFLVEKNSLHNLLVAVYALTDILLTSLQNYLVSLDDPFHRFVELITRYSIYRNYVIEVEENLAFLFEEYDGLYSQVFRSDKPKYRFWRGAMTKWLLKFSDLHKQANSIYYYCLAKQRTQYMLEFLEKKSQQTPEFYMQIKNKAYLREYELAVNSMGISDYTSNGVEDFFKENPEQYNILLTQYLEYMVDLSINEETVHWCGHSRQPLSQPFLSFQKTVLIENKGFLKYVRNLHKQNVFQREYFTQEIQFLESIEIKPLMLQKIIEYYNMELNDTPTTAQNFVPLSYNFQTNDSVLGYFNERASIKFTIPEQDMCFYSITPLVSANELLTKSISTNYDSEAHESDKQSNSEIEYMSESSSVNEQQSQDFHQQSKRQIQPQSTSTRPIQSNFSRVQLRKARRKQKKCKIQANCRKSVNYRVTNRQKMENLRRKNKKKVRFEEVSLNKECYSSPFDIIRKLFMKQSI